MNVKDIIFWIFLILSLVLLGWYVFGNSPTEFITIITIIFTLILKVWSISDREIKLETKFEVLGEKLKDGFNKVKEDMDLIKKKLKI